MCLTIRAQTLSEAVHMAHPLMHLFIALSERLSGAPTGGRAFGWPTKDICGMSLFGEGLQLVVTPAVLSVAVPGVLHHLEDKNREVSRRSRFFFKKKTTKKRQ